MCFCVGGFAFVSRISGQQEGGTSLKEMKSQTERVCQINLVVNSLFDIGLGVGCHICHASVVWY